jgi:Flp pilus assembly protein TadD
VLLVCSLAVGCRTTREEPFDVVSVSGQLHFESLLFDTRDGQTNATVLWHAIQREPHNAEKRFELARVLLKNDHATAATVVLNDPACKAAPNSQYYLLLATALQRGTPAAARRVTGLLQEAERRFPGDADVTIGLGHAFNNNGQPELALEKFNQALLRELDPDLELSAGLGRIVSLRKTGQLAAAERERAKLNQSWPGFENLLRQATIAEQLPVAGFGGNIEVDVVHGSPHERSKLVLKEIERVSKPPK